MDIPEKIIAGCLKNQYSSQEWLYKKVFPYMMGICYRYTFSKELSKEITHDAFFKVLKNLDKYNREFSFKTWISKITVNTIIDHLRKEKHFLKMNDLPFENNQYHPIENHTVFNEAISRLELKDIYKLLEKLKPIEKNIFNLFIIDGFSHHEIAEMLEISEDLSKWYLKTARNKLKKWITEELFSTVKN